MPYSYKFIELVKSRPSSLGVRLGKWAIYHDIPVTKLAMAVGSTRQSVYAWMKGGEIFVAYKPRVERIVEILQKSKTTEQAWSAVCKEFDLRT